MDEGGTADGRPSWKDLWISVPHWDKFQHYADRDPTWIKVYVSLLHNPKFLHSSAASRGLLMTIWLLYAAENGPFPSRYLARYGNKVAGFHQLKSLSDAGFITLSASKMLAPKKEKRRVREKKPETMTVENLKKPLVAEILKRRALDVAADWSGTDSNEFDAQLDQLEKNHRQKLPYALRNELWEIALKRSV